MSSGELLIIFGAGASFDCVDVIKPSTSVNTEFWPPLTDHIFDRKDIKEGTRQVLKVNEFRNDLLNKHIMASSILFSAVKHQTFFDLN